ncbi:ABC transporter ATP-binding protein [Anaerolentibacter hominis]|uniref:ABC transporter ATP-binding protein n=1 Tax=Anaerolentibacter hominis TaxID=3079009 RepID=UPI0031B8819F
MIQIENVSKSYDDFLAVDDVSITVEKGTVHGLIGENGSGKTTLIKCMTGIYKADKGEIRMAGEPVFENPEVKQKIGYVADYNQYFPTYRVDQMIRFYQDMYPKFEEDAFYDYNKVFHLDVDKRIAQLSKGQKMRLAIMLNLAMRPEILILDEPTSGLDAIAKKEVLDLIVSEVEERNLTVFISSHHLAELEKICDTVSIIHNGKIKYQDDIDEIKTKIRKLQVVFPEGMPAGFMKNYNVIDCSNSGSIYQVVLPSVNDAAVARMKEDGAVLVEEIPITLEEMFIYTNKEE